MQGKSQVSRCEQGIVVFIGYHIGGLTLHQGKSSWSSWRSMGVTLAQEVFILQYV